jgi:hypothetical protein
MLRSIRYWGPLVLGFACLLAVPVAGTLVAWILIAVGFGLIMDGATALWARSTRAGGIGSYRQ